MVKLLRVWMFLFVLGLLFILPGLVLAQGPSPSPSEPPGLPQLQNLIVSVIAIFGLLVFFAMTVMLVVAGVRFLTSGGEPKLLQAAWQTFTWAILGILFLALGWLFLLLIEAFTGVKVTQFSLKFPP